MGTQKHAELIDAARHGVSKVGSAHGEGSLDRLGAAANQIQVSLEIPYIPSHPMEDQLCVLSFLPRGDDD